MDICMYTNYIHQKTTNRTMKKALTAVVTSVILLAAGCSTTTNNTTTDDNGRGVERVTRQRYESLYTDPWPFESNELIVSCRPKPNSNNTLVSVRVPNDGRVYGVNGTAQSYFERSFHDLREKYEDGSRKLGGVQIIKIGFSLCERNKK